MKDETLQAMSYIMELSREYCADYTVYDIAQSDYEWFQDQIGKVYNAMIEATIPDTEHAQVVEDAMLECDKGRTLPWEIYLSLSGHGAGFWDWKNSKHGDALQAIAEDTLGKYFFEETTFYTCDNGDLHLIR